MDEQEFNIDQLIAGTDIASVIKVLMTGRRSELPKMDDIKKEFNPSEHKIFDKTYRQDKTIEDENGNTTGTIKVNRLGFPLQKRIVNSTVAFTFGNPVEYSSNPADTNEEEVLTAMQRIDYDNKMPSFNRKVARDLARCTEVAELWYTVPLTESHNTYGFDNKFKIRVMILSPWNGNLLYPYFDSTGDLLAFSRQYEDIGMDGKKKTYFETYTTTKKVIWVKQDSDWQVVRTENLPFGKIPVVFAKQDQTEWADVQGNIERLELLLSNFAETNDYHAAPKIFVQGKIAGWSQKGESGAIIEGEVGSSAQYLSWNHAPEAVKLEIETLLRFIYGFTQTPDISFDSVKGLQAISGEALKMLFMDAHLKVQEKKEIFDEYLQRRVSVVKAMIGSIQTGLKKAADSLQVIPNIVPFIINSEAANIQNLVTANGGKAIISQRTSVMLGGYVEDIDEEMALIKAEEEASGVSDIFEPQE